MLCFAWTSDLNLLKSFVKENLKLEGSWSQPGSDRKVFTSDNLTIIWKKNKNILSLEGEKAEEITKELCWQMCSGGEFSSETPASVPGQPSTQLSAIGETLESLKLGQSINSEALQALSGTISHLTSVMAQFQSFMDNNQVFDHGKDVRAEQINIMDSSFKNAKDADRDNSSNSNSANSDILCDSNVFTNPIVNNENTSKDTNNEAESVYNVTSAGVESDYNLTSAEVVSDHNLTSAEQTSIIKNHQPTYANVAASHFSSNNQSLNEKLKTINDPERNHDINLQSEIIESPNASEEFIGVERKRNRIKRFFLTGIAEHVKANQIKSYLEQRGVFPTYITVFSSRRRGTLSCKLHVKTVDSTLVQETGFWPKFVNCKLWQPNKIRNSTNTSGELRVKLTQEGNISTYV